MTLLQMVNRVLRRLREDQVTDLTSSPYSKVIAEFVADAHREVVEAHDWLSMDHDLTLTVNVGQSEYDLEAGSADIYAGTGTTRKSQVRYDKDEPVAFWFDSLTDLANGVNASRLSQYAPNAQAVEIITRNSLSAEPCGFALVPHATKDSLVLRLDTVPDTTGYIKIKFNTPEAEIDVDTDANRTLYAPSAPVIARAIFYALNERGEEMGEPGGVAEGRSIASIENAIENDRIRASRSNTYEMYRD